MLPSDGIIAWLKGGRHYVGFPNELGNELYDLEAKQHDPNFKFMDKSLEARRQALLRAMTEYFLLAGTKTFTSRDGSLNVVPPEWKRGADRREYDEAIKELDRLGTEVAA